MAKNNKKPTAKKPAAKSAKPAPKKSPTPARKPAPAPKPAPALAKARPSTMEKPSKKTALRDNILKLKQKAPAKPIAFSLDEVRAIAKTVTTKTAAPFPKGVGGTRRNETDPSPDTAGALNPTFAGEGLAS